MSSFCPNCGAPTAAGERFCGACGQMLEPAQAPAPAPESPLEQTRIAGSRTIDAHQPPAADPSAAAPVTDSPWAPSAEPAQPDAGHAPAQPEVQAPQAAEPQGQPQWGAPQPPQHAAPPAPPQWGAPPPQQPQQPQPQQQAWGAAPAQPQGQPQGQSQWGAPQPPQAPQQQWGAPQGQPAPQQWGAPAPGQPQWGAPGQPAWGQPQQQVQMANPFKGTSIGDWVRDGAAVLLGFMSLGYVWSIDAGDSLPWWAIISAILTALSVVVSYVPRLGVQAIPAKTAWLIKLGLNVPSILSILLVLVMELVKLTKDGSDFTSAPEGGIGLAVTVLAAAVAFAISPRTFEPEAGALLPWRTVAVALTGVGIAGIVLSTIGWVIKAEVLSDKPLAGIGLIVFGILVPVALVATPLKSFASGQAAGALVLGTSAVGLLAIYILVSGTDEVNNIGGKLISWNFGWLPGIALSFLLAAAGALALSAPVLRAAHFRDTGAQWLSTARLAALTSVIGVAVMVVGVILGQIGSEGEWGGRLITTLVLSILAALLMGAALATLPQGPGNALQVPVLAVAVASVLGLVLFIMDFTSDDVGPSGSEYLVAVTFLPILALAVLTIPPSMRREFPKLFTPAAPAAPQWGAPQMPQAPGAPQQWGAPQAPGAPQQWGAPQPPQQAPQQWGAPQAPQAPQQWGAPPQPPAPGNHQQWGPPQG